MPNFSEGKFAIGSLVFFAFWLFVVLPVVHAQPYPGPPEATEYWTIARHHLKITDTLLVVFTFFLAVSTVFLWLATRRSAQIAERALTELEAPFIALNIIDDGLKPYQMVGVGDKTFQIAALPIALTFSFYNHGRTPAVFLELQDKLQVCEKGKLPDLDWPGRKTNYPYGVFIGPGVQYAPSTRFFKDYIENEKTDVEWREWREDIEKGQSSLFLVGRLRYRDLFENTFEMGFCAEFSCVDKHFLMREDKRYNYLSRIGSV